MVSDGRKMHKTKGMINAMKNDSTENKIISIIQKNLDSPIELSPKTNLLTECSLDSLQSIKILIDIEREFNITFPNEDLTLDILNTIEIFCQYVKELIFNQQQK